MQSIAVYLTIPAVAISLSQKKSRNRTSMNKPLNPEETPTELIEDLNAYGRIFETTMAGMADKHNMDISVISRLFNKEVLKVTDRYITFTPTPPFPLVREKHQPESIKFLTSKDILDEDTIIDTRVLAEKTTASSEAEPTPSIPIVFESDGLTPTPDIFDQPTPTHAEDTQYQALIALAVPHPDFTTGPLPEYVQFDHELSPTPQNPIHPKVIFSLTAKPDTITQPRDWTLPEAIRELGDFSFESFSITPSPATLEIDWSDFNLDKEE